MHSSVSVSEFLWHVVVEITSFHEQTLLLLMLERFLLDPPLSNSDSTTEQNVATHSKWQGLWAPEWYCINSRRRIMHALGAAFRMSLISWVHEGWDNKSVPVVLLVWESVAYVASVECRSCNVWSLCDGCRMKISFWIAELTLWLTDKLTGMVSDQGQGLSRDLCLCGKLEAGNQGAG